MAFSWSAQASASSLTEILCPLGPEDLGVLPYRVSAVGDLDGLNSLTGLLSTQVGWPEDMEPGSARQLGLFFEGIAYPLSNPSILDWTPATGTVELLNLPAQAWWGPPAGAGALQLRRPDFSDDPAGRLTVEGGTGDFGNISGGYSDSSLSLAGDYRRTSFTDFSRRDSTALDLSASANFCRVGPWKAQGAFLGLQNGDGDDWYVGQGDFQWTDGNFQTILFRPYFQKAQASQDQADEWGSRLAYRLDMAGILEGGLTTGFSRLRLTQGGFSSSVDRGFIQDAECVDALGDFALNLAFRLDWDEVVPTRFSTLLGAQYRVGLASFVVDYTDGTDPIAQSTTRQTELGAKLRLEEQTEWDLIYLHEDESGEDLNGVESKWGSALSFLNGPVWDGSFFQIELQDLVDSTQRNFSDMGLEFKSLWFRSIGAEVSGRMIQGGPFLGIARLSCRLNSHCLVFLTGQNLENDPVSWPEPDVTPGFNLMGGTRIDF